MTVWIKRALLSIAVFGMLSATSVAGEIGRGQEIEPGNGTSSKPVVLRPTGPVPDQYIVVFEDYVTNPRGLASALARRNGFTLGPVYEFALKGFAARMPAPVVQALALDPDVAYIERDIYTHAVDLPTGVDRIDADFNFFANIDGFDDRVDVDIAILDTGIDLTHPDLNVFQSIDCTSGRLFIRCRGSGDDGNGHGTHVAGTAAALDNGVNVNGVDVVGVAPGARLWAVKVLGNNGSGSMAMSIAGLDYVASNKDEIEVANMSLSGTGQLASLRTALQNTVNAGVVVVVAAGNASVDIYGEDGIFDTGDERIPAAYPEAATVSGLRDTDGQAGGIDGTADDTFYANTNYSASVVSGNPVNSSGAGIDVAAPAVSVLSTYFNNGYAWGTGTSMASPHVAGAVALYIAEYGRAFDAAGVYAIRQAVIDTAEPQSQWRTGSTNDPDNNPEGLVDAESGGSFNQAPAVSITTPSTDPASFDSGASISFAGTADDEDGDLKDSLQWASSIDGALNNENSASSFSQVLSDGTHTITASVDDSEGETGSATITVIVASASGMVGVDPLQYATEGGRDGTKHLLVTVELNPAVEGASVSVSISGPKAATGAGTTDALGEVTFALKNAPAGTYTTTITDVTASGLTWDGSQPPNSSYDKP